METGLLPIVAASVLACLLLMAGASWALNRKALRLCPMQAPLQQHGPVQWHALDIGTHHPSDITVLLVHGLGGNMRHFQAGPQGGAAHGMHALLAQTHRVIAVDRPGSGYSRIQAGQQHLTLQQQAQALHDLLDHQGVGRVLIVGHSLGGAIALAMAQQRPERVAGLALLAPLTAMLDKAPPMFAPLALVPRLLHPFMAYTLLPVMVRLVQNLNLRAVFHPEPVPASFATHGGGSLSGRPSQLLAIMRDMLVGFQDMPGIEAACANLKLPVHVLYDHADNVLDAQRHGVQLPQRLPGAKVDFMDHAGHMLPITQSLHCANWVRQVLNTWPAQAKQATP